MHRTVVPAVLGALAAIAVFGPFFAVVDASSSQTVVHHAPGIALEGRVDNATFDEPAVVGCGEILIDDARSSITDGAGIVGVVVADGVEFRAATTEIQVVTVGGATVCVDAEGTLHDGTGETVGRWRVRPDHMGADVLTSVLG